MGLIDSIMTPLEASWRHLAFLNYEVDPAILAPYIPAGTEIDDRDGTVYMSLVGLTFKDTTFFGIPDPLHQEFEQVNFRFYVRRKGEDGWRHGVVFVKEIVPAALMTFGARTFLNERYQTMPMRHRIDQKDGLLLEGATVAYGWQFNKQWCEMFVRIKGPAHPVGEGSIEDFVTTRFWGYAKQPDGGTIEYRVDHPRWVIYDTAESSLICDVEALYGRQFVPYLQNAPAWAHVAEGSSVKVLEAHRL